MAANQLPPFNKKKGEPCPQCGAPMRQTEPDRWPGGFNFELICPAHGRQFTVSTRTDL